MQSIRNRWYEVLSRRWGGVLPGILISLLMALPCTGGAHPSACVPGWMPFRGYSFINPDIVLHRSDMAPHFLNFGQLAGYFDKQAPADVVENLNEWRERVCRSASIADIRAVVYDASPSALDQMRYALRSTKPSLQAMGGGYADNGFVRYLYRNRCTEILDYLLFTRNCEDYVGASRAWDDSPSRANAMRQMAREAQDQFLGVRSHYIRLRYAFQIVRLLHYAGDHQGVLDAYDYLMPKIDHDPSIIEYWILGHRAGALLALGQHVEAAYLYAKIFDQSPGKRASAHRSFRIRNDEEWEACLLLCRNDRERATLFLMRANTDGARLVEEMTQIYELFPQHEGLQLLLVREMANLEKDLLGITFNTRRQQNLRFHQRPRPIAGQRVVELQDFVRRVLRERRATHLELWKIAEGYLEVLAGNHYFASQSFASARRLVQNDTLRHQLETFELALKIAALDQIDDPTERELYDIRRNSEIFKAFPDFPRFLNDKLSDLYTSLGLEGKAFMLRHDVRDLKLALKADLIDDLLMICRKERKNPFEQLLVQRPDGSSIEKALLDLKTTLLMQEYYVEAALETFKQIPEEEWDNYGLFSPFVDRINDCVRCRLPDTARLYNKGELLNKLVDLEYQARAQTNPNTKAQNYYDIGLAWYNMSYFSYDWRALDYFRSSVSINRKKSGPAHNETAYAGHAFPNREHFDTDQARFYLERARALATDPERKAQCAYMIAKCERNKHYQYRDRGDLPRTYDGFTALAQEYNRTTFYARLIQECKYFAAFTTR